jgi:nitrous-oxide reductase
MFLRQLKSSRLVFIAVVIMATAVLAVVQRGATTSAQGNSADWQSVAQARGLTDEDIRAAVMTYTPSGVYDQYLMFASGGHSGQVLVIGMPSMRLLRVIGVFTPEPWQGWG